MNEQPIFRLAGATLADGWQVIERFNPPAASTGGSFSVSYKVRNADGKEGFLKAFDFRRAEDAVDTAEALREMTTLYLYERDLLKYCQEKKIRNVVTSVSHGEIRVDDSRLGTVYYIIFELADGDSRSQMSINGMRDFAWILSALHSISNALDRLHHNLIYHQDLKPSNVLVFDGGDRNKLADLGRSHSEVLKSPLERYIIPGDRQYAPPEQMYYFCPEDGRIKRVAGDVYHLGSMMFFFFTGNMLTPILVDGLLPEHRPFSTRTREGWLGEGRDILPYLHSSFGNAVLMMEESLREEIPPRLHEKFIPELLALFKMLADPDPQLRGHPRNRANKQADSLSLERFVSAFDRLSKAAVVLKRRDAA